MACSDNTALLGCSDALGEYFKLYSLLAIAQYLWQFETMRTVAIQLDINTFQSSVL